MTMEATMKSHGTVSVKRIRAESGPGLRWQASNYLRWNFLKSLVGVKLIVPLARRFGIMTGYGALYAVLIKHDGRRINYGLLSYRLITDAGVALLADDFVDASGEVSGLKYHGLGTGGAAEAVGNTGLTTECTTALNPDSTRATGTNTNPTAPVYQTVGTLTFDNTAAVTEHGIFSQAATGGGTLWDRSLFSAINVVSGDSIQVTYQCTFTSGG
jgi:hypothetical protein